MFTLHHGFWLYFISRKHYQVWQFVLGSMLPDYVYFILLGVLLAEGRIAFHQVALLDPQQFGSYIPQYPWAVQADLILHSVVSWFIAFAVTLLPFFNRWQSFAVGWGTHLLIDTLTHGAEANYYLYPLSMERVHSSVSYWEPGYFAREYNLIHNAVLVLALLYLLWQRVRKKRPRP